jgi:hypothetical protein
MPRPVEGQSRQRPLSQRRGVRCGAQAAEAAREPRKQQVDNEGAQGLCMKECRNWAQTLQQCCWSPGGRSHGEVRQGYHGPGSWQRETQSALQLEGWLLSPWTGAGGHREPSKWQMPPKVGYWLRGRRLRPELMEHGQVLRGESRSETGDPNRGAGSCPDGQKGGPGWASSRWICPTRSSFRSSPAFLS